MAFGQLNIGDVAWSNMRRAVVTDFCLHYSDLSIVNIASGSFWEDCFFVIYNVTVY